MFFREALAQLRDHQDEFEAAGVRLGLVVQAEPDEARAVCADVPRAVCVPDPEHVTHRALGLGKMSLAGMLTSKGLRERHKEAVSAGHGQHWGRTFSRSSAWTLLPGAALVAQGGALLWVHRGEHVGDLPTAETLLARARAALERA